MIPGSIISTLLKTVTSAVNLLAGVWRKTVVREFTQNAKYLVGYFWVFGSNNALERSGFGDTWQTINVNTSANGISAVNTIYDIGYFGGKYILGTSPATVSELFLTSTDGVNWQKYGGTATNFSVVRGLANNASVIVAVGQYSTNRVIFSSPDGITWTQRLSVASGNYTRVIWAGTQFVAVGSNGTTGVIVTSPDGITWTQRTFSGTATTFTGVAWNGTTFCALGQSGVPNMVSSTSADGITWTASPIIRAGTSGTIVWDGTRFIAGNASGYNPSYSADGVTWVSPGNGAYYNSATFLATDGSITVGATAPNGKVVSYDNGASWETILKYLGTGNTGFNFTNIAPIMLKNVNSKLYVADTSNRIYASSNGSSWYSPTTAAALASNPTCVSGDDASLVIMVGLTGLTARSTDNGVTFTVNTSDTTSWNTCSTNSTMSIKAGAGGALKSSPDGITWTTRTSGTAGAIAASAWNGAVFCIVAPNFCATSPDGITWTAGTLTTMTPTSLVWTGSQFVVVGNTGVIRTSTNGSTWTTRTSGTTSNFKQVVTNDGYSGEVIATTTIGTVYASFDFGATWVQRSSVPTGTSVQAAILMSALYVLTSGNNAGLMQSWDAAATWELLPSALTSTGVNKLLKVGTDYHSVFLGLDSNTYHGISSDLGATWRYRYIQGGTAYDINNDGPLWVACSSVIRTSPKNVPIGDMVWTQRTIGIGAFIRSVAWNGSMYVAVASNQTDTVAGNSGGIATSTDGITWTTQASFPLVKVIWSTIDNVWIAVGNTNIYVSSNGLSWNLFNPPSVTGALLKDVVVGNGQHVFVAQGTNGKVWTSPTSGSYTLQASTVLTTSANFAIRAVAYGGGKYMAVLSGTAGGAYISNDGVTWTSTPMGTGGTGNTVVWDETLQAFVCATNTRAGMFVYYV